MDVKADFASPVHLDSLAVELRQLKVHWRVWVGRGDLKLECELPLDKVVDNPALACPLSAILVRLNLEPIIVLLLIHAHVVDKQRVLLFESLAPLWIPGTSNCVQQG